MGKTPSRSIAVLGGGITGLTAAYRLTRLGHRVRLFEQTGRIGGAIHTETTDGWLIERGPNSIQLSGREIPALLQELGLESEKVAASTAAKYRYLVRDGRLIAVPTSPPSFLRSPLFSLGAKLRVMAELTSRRRTRDADLSLADFIREHFGSEILDYAAQPFVGGIYAGDVTQLSTRHAFPLLWELEREYGSILRGQMARAKAKRTSGDSAIPSIISFRRGLQTLTHALVTRLPSDTLVLNARVEALVHDTSWKVRWSDGATERSESFDTVISALPAVAMSRLQFGETRETPLAGLQEIHHPAVTSLFLGYRREQIGHPLDGFGALVPSVEKRSILGVVFSSSLFEGRAPAGHGALTVMIGGTTRPDLPGREPSALLAAVRGDLADLLQVKGDPVFMGHAYWPRAIPQYNLGYERHLELMAACERDYPGVFIGGSVRDGISVPDCIRSGLKLADRVSQI